MKKSTKWAIGQFIVDHEARRDSRGRIAVYRLPAGDGGGRYEVAGINDRYHPDMAARLKHLIEVGRQAEAEGEAVRYLLNYTDRVVGWHPDMRVRTFLRDCAFNRGPGGAAKILQHALKVAGTYSARIDGGVGPLTKAAARKHKAEDLLPRLLLSRQWYERVKVGRNERSKFWSGLVNRWIDALQVALDIGDPEKFGE